MADDIMDLIDFGAPGKWLAAQGWAIIPANRDRGTAACDGRNKRILVKPSALIRPSTRVRRYVIPHEIWHGIHYEASRYNVDTLMGVRSLDRRSAIEVVADAACLRSERSRSMRLWVQASILWHGKVGYRYRWADIISPEANAAVDALFATIKDRRD